MSEGNESVVGVRLGGGGEAGEHADAATDPDRHFRHVMSHVPTGVVVITGEADHGPAGLAVGSFASISLRPALVGFFCDRESTSWPPIRGSGGFCVNILAHDQPALSARFARKGGAKFEGLSYERAPHTQSPILEGVLAWIDCTIEREVEVGDHMLVVGHALELELAKSGHPLVFFRSQYSVLGSL
jgi:flavin reductase (DIM6/NTAB) family NADH-FMN oxidoreductase RutF